MTFTKLFSSITESTVWCEDAHTKVVWITMLAMADRKGRVWASIPGLASRAKVSIDRTEAALNRFQQPDKYSRTKDNEGRRIEPIDGGWVLLNHAKYRAIRDEEERRNYKTAKQREYRSVDKSGQPCTGVDASGHNAEADTEAEKKIGRNSTEGFNDFWSAYPKKVKKKTALEIWKRKRLFELSTNITSDVQNRLARDQRWLDGFVPDPTTYLNGERWNDEITKAGSGKESSDDVAARLGVTRGENEPTDRYEKRVSDALVAEQYG